MCREPFLRSAHQMWICSALTCFPGAVKECFKSPETSVRRTFLPYPCSLHHSLGGYCKSKHIILPKTSVFSLCAPRYTTPPSFHQQSTAQTNRSSIYLACKHSLLHTQQESKLQKCSANEEIQTGMSAAINKQNCPNRSELDPPLLHMRAPTNSYNF